MTEDRVTLTIDTKRLRRAIVAVVIRLEHEHLTPEQMTDQIWVEYARLSDTETAGEAGDGL